jgi:hypothetical protein
MNLYDQYKQEYREFTKITDMNMEDRVMRVPSEKHLWVERLIDAKKLKFKLLKERKQLKDANIKKAISEGIVNLSKQTLDKLENTTEIEEIDVKLQDMDLLIEYLDYVVKGITYIAQDIRNMISIKEMQM